MTQSFSPQAPRRAKPSELRDVPSSPSLSRSSADQLKLPSSRLDRRNLDCKNLGWKNLHWRTVLLCLALIAAVFAVYYPVIHNQFLTYDDNEYITDNPHVKAGLTWATVEWAFTSFAQSNWHPVTWLSHALDCQVFGLNPAGPHVVNVLLHALNAVLLFLLLQSATGFRGRSLMVAALFALHPMNVESVAWAAERKNVLCTLFFLLALYAYQQYARSSDARAASPADSRRTTRLYAAMVACFALALLAKPQVITFPFLLWLWDYWPLRRINSLNIFASPEAASKAATWWNRKVIWEKAPLLLLSAMSAVVTMKAQKAGGAIKDLSRYSLPLRIETAIISYVRYLGKLFWPAKLVALYPHPTRLYPAWQVIAATLLLLLITAVALRARQRRYLLVGWLWFLGSLVPMIGLVQVGVQALADRYAYISFIGLFVMIVWQVADWTSEKQEEKEEATRNSTRWLLAPALCCLLALGLATHRQVGYWHDPESFWLRTIALTQDNYVAHRGLAAVYHILGKPDQMLAQIHEVLAIRPEDAYSNLVLGDDERKSGDMTAALEHYRIVAEQPAQPNFIRAGAYANMGHTYHQMGQTAKAKESFEQSLKFEPNQPTVMVELGLIAQLGGDTATAVHEFSQAMRLQPTDVGLLLLANALLEEGKTAESDKILDQAVRLSKDIDAAEAQAKKLLGEK